MNSSEYLNTIVDDLVDIFDTNLVDGAITTEGLSELADMFGTTPIELRAVIYRSFVQELNRKGIGHEFQCFMGDC